MEKVPKKTGLVPVGDDEKGVIGQDLIKKYGSQEGAEAAVSFLVFREDGILPVKGNTRLFRRLVTLGSKRQIRDTVTGISGELIGMYTAGKITLTVLQRRLNKILEFDQEWNCNETRLAIERLGDDGAKLLGLLSVKASIKLGMADLDYCNAEKLARYMVSLSSKFSYRANEISRTRKSGSSVSEFMVLNFAITRRDLREVVAVVVDRFESGDIDDDDESSGILADVCQALINEDGEIPIYLEEAINFLIEDGIESAEIFHQYLKQEVEADPYDY